MRVFERIAELREALDAERAAGRRVGFVPTMGALHAGHLSLVARARAEREVVVVSIFVNPAQFGPEEDFDRYPRTPEADLAACRSAGVDVVFMPPVAEMYPSPPRTVIRVTGLDEPMEGALRPGHFAGVALVVAKLFAIVGPCRAYFGEKDAQQLRVVRRLAEDLSFPVEVVACETVRDPDGLALSSRNAYLSAEDRRRAAALPRALRAIQQAVAEGVRDAAALEAVGREALAGVDAVDYLCCVDPETLQPLQRVEGEALVCAAVRVGGTRLIDNVRVQAAPLGAAVEPAAEGGRA